MLDSNKFLFEALTYDDVLLLPAYSEVLPREVSTQSRLTRNITLNIPIVSAAMDTVTEADLAIVMGGKNSSNSSHLVELCERKLPTYFIDDVSKIIDANQIEKTNWKNKQSEVVHNFLPDINPIRILMTSGASCPDTVVESVIKKILSFYDLEDAFDKVKDNWID